MSQYISFYIKGNDRFYPLLELSRNHTLAQFCRMMPYEKVRAISVEGLKNLLKEVTDQIDKEHKYLRDKEALQRQISTFNNSIEEKLEVIDRLHEDIDEINENLEDLYVVRGAFITLLWAAECAADTQFYSDAPRLDGDKYIYAGWEVGTNPSFEDIEE